MHTETLDTPAKITDFTRDVGALGGTLTLKYPDAVVTLSGDGLVDGGLVPDDTALFMVKLMPRITHRPKREGEACVVFRVAEIPPAFRPDNVQAIVDRLGLEEQ